MDRSRRVHIAHHAALCMAALSLASCGTQEAPSPAARVSLNHSHSDQQGAQLTSCMDERNLRVNRPSGSRLAEPKLILADEAVAIGLPFSPDHALTGLRVSHGEAPSDQTAERPPADRMTAYPDEVDRSPPALAQRGVVPFASLPTPRPPQMEHVAQRADEHSRRGFELAGRKAYYSARVEFIKALRTVAQALDTQHGKTAHTDALVHGLRALKEADDFVARGSWIESTTDVAGIVAIHRTPVLKNVDLTRASPLAASQSYYTYAQEQLGVSAGREMAGSMALHGLGKVYAVLSPEDEGSALACQRAALLVNKGNFMAANEYGVLLARVGKYQHARAALMQSLSVVEHPATWRNLAVVHQALGEGPLAHLALQEAQLAAAGGPDGRPISESAQGVRWLVPESFARTSRQQNAGAIAAPKRQSQELKEESTAGGIMSWLPWKGVRE